MTLKQSLIKYEHTKIIGFLLEKFYKKSTDKIRKKVLKSYTRMIKDLLKLKGVENSLKINFKVNTEEKDLWEKYISYIQEGKEIFSLFIDWNEIINSEIIFPENIEKELFLSMILFELSWDGLTYKKNKKNIDFLLKKINKSKKDIETGKSKTYSIDDLKLEEEKTKAFNDALKLKK